MTPRQLEVLLTRCQTGSAEETAYRLCISPRTVRRHLLNIQNAAGLQDVAQACWHYRDELVQAALANPATYRGAA